MTSQSWKAQDPQIRKNTAVFIQLIRLSLVSGISLKITLFQSSFWLKNNFPLCMHVFWTHPSMTSTQVASLTKAAINISMKISPELHFFGRKLQKILFALQVLLTKATHCSKQREESTSHLRNTPGSLDKQQDKM